MYKSTIELDFSEQISDAIQTELEGTIVRGCIEVGVHVDRDELLKALAYDRMQYEKGYADAMAECKEQIKSLKEMAEYFRDRCDFLMGGM